MLKRYLIYLEVVHDQKQVLLGHRDQASGEIV